MMGSNGAGDVQGAEQGGFDLRTEVFRVTAVSAELIQEHASNELAPMASVSLPRSSAFLPRSVSADDSERVAERQPGMAGLGDLSQAALFDSMIGLTMGVA
jgi:hypothetical protein